MIEIITSAPSQDLTMLATAKQELGVTGTASDARIAELILQASSACAAYCNRPRGFGRATFRETLRPFGGRMCLTVIVLLEDIAPLVSSVVVDGVALDAADWTLQGSLLYRLTSDAPAQWHYTSKIMITYQAGFELLATLPAGIERACLITVQALYASQGANPLIRSVSAEDVGQVSFLDPRTGMEALPAQAAGLLAPYRALCL